MREILFRGKRVDSGRWVYGFYGHKPNGNEVEEHFIIEMAIQSTSDLVYTHFVSIPVIPETVGQYTGLDDQNGRYIFEGDIVENGNTIVYADKTTRRFASVGVVKTDVKNGCMVIHNTNGTTKRLTQKTIDSCKIKVIGNTTFNPELLKEGTK